MKDAIKTFCGVKNSVNRRQFMAGAGLAALSFSVIKPDQVSGTEANSKIKLGMVGCGNRGKWITNLFLKHGGYEITAAADYFPDRLEAFGEKFHIPQTHRYSNLSCYKKLLGRADVDAIVIESPPYFHPEQAAAGVEAGKHVYVAKPIAVDVPGCRLIEQSGALARKKK